MKSPRSSIRPYGTHLAYIHDAGFTGFAADAGAGILRFLRKIGLGNGRVVELGCGSGAVAAALPRAGYSVHGFDLSRDMIRLARRNVPAARFSVGSLWRATIPPCDAVLCVGECLNYEFDGPVTLAGLEALFGRINLALPPGGAFVFDFLCETGEHSPVCTRRWTEGEEWFVAVERHETPKTITRRIVSFRRARNSYVKSVEIHRQRKHPWKEIVDCLKTNGFSVVVRRGYLPRKPLRANHMVFFAVKR